MEREVLIIINSILKKNDREPINRFDNNLSLRADFGFDSLELAELTVRIEDKYGIDIFEHRIVDKLYEIIEALEK